MWLMLLVLAAVVAADQGSKAMVMARLPEGAPTRGAVLGVRLRHVVNRRRPWRSVAAVRLMTVAWLLLAAAGCLLASAIDLGAARVAVGALVGGAAGNLIDGVRRRAVTDFIDLRVWPVFNVADAALTAGAALLAWSAIRSL